MRLFIIAAAMAAACVAQTAKPDNPVIAVIDGVSFTQADFNTLLVVMDPKLRDAAGKNPAEVLRMYGFLKRLSSMAEKEGLHNQTPYKEKLESARQTLLANAMLDWQYQSILVTAEEQKKYYQEHLDKYRQAKLKMIYIPFLNKDEEAAAKATAETVVARARKGEDFVKLVKEFSKHADTLAKDGDFGPIKASDDLPGNIKKVVFSMQNGQISDPIWHTNGFYIFRMDEMKVDPYNSVKDQIYNEIKEMRKNDWLGKVRASVDVKILSQPKVE